MTNGNASKGRMTAEYRGATAGLSEPLFRKVIWFFYEKVRRDPLLSPVFEEAIGDDWDPHIERIMLFWLTATGVQRGYEDRNFMPAHLRHASVRAELLPRWLELFRQTTEEHCEPEPARALVDIAERMAQTLEIGLARKDQQPPKS
jgi:hemoglobin